MKIATAVVTIAQKRCGCFSPSPSWERFSLNARSRTLAGRAFVYHGSLSLDTVSLGVLQFVRAIFCAAARTPGIRRLFQYFVCKNRERCGSARLSRQGRALPGAPGTDP
jgi:hypothetical protein